MVKATEDTAARYSSKSTDAAVQPSSRPPIRKPMSSITRLPNTSWPPVRRVASMRRVRIFSVTEPKP